MPYLTLVVTLEWDLHIAGASSPTLQSAALPSAVSRWRAGSPVIGWPSWMEWDGRNKGQVAMTVSLLCACLVHSLKSNPKDTARSDLNVILSVLFLFLVLPLSSCGKQYTTKISRSSLKVSPSLEFLSYWSNFLPAFELAFFCEMLFSRLAVLIMCCQSFISLTQMGRWWLVAVMLPITVLCRWQELSTNRVKEAMLSV